VSGRGSGYRRTGRAGVLGSTVDPSQGRDGGRDGAQDPDGNEISGLGQDRTGGRRERGLAGGLDRVWFCTRDAGRMVPDRVCEVAEIAWAWVSTGRPVAAETEDPLVVITWPWVRPDEVAALNRVQFETRSTNLPKSPWIAIGVFALDGVSVNLILCCRIEMIRR
jgi:hypothetical protein